MARRRLDTVKKKKHVSKAKAKKIMKHGEVKGKPLTEKQRGYFGLLAGGGNPTKMTNQRSPRRKKKRGK